MKYAEPGSGHSTAPMFTGASSDITFLLDLTRCRPSPGTRLSRARSTTAAPPHPRLQPASRLSGPRILDGYRTGTDTDGSHVHCCPVDGLGTRLYPCGFAAATAVGNSPRPPGPGPEYPARSSPLVMKSGCAPPSSPNPPG